MGATRMHYFARCEHPGCTEAEAFVGDSYEALLDGGPESARTLHLYCPAHAERHAAR